MKPNKVFNIAEHRKRLTERFKRSEFDGFCDYEIVEFILIFVTSKKDLKSLAKRLLSKFKGLKGIFEASQEELESIKDIDEKAAIFIRSIREFAGFYLKERIQKKNVLQHSKDVLDFLKFKLCNRKTENFLTIYLNSKSEVLGVETLHEGTTNKVYICRRKVIESALKNKAHSIIFVHNHPSGDPAPSLADQELASILEMAALAIDLNVHDHIIIGKNTYFSWREHGLMIGGSARFPYFVKPLQRMLAESNKES